MLSRAVCLAFGSETCVVRAPSPCALFRRTGLVCDFAEAALAEGREAPSLAPAVAAAERLSRRRRPSRQEQGLPPPSPRTAEALVAEGRGTPLRRAS